MPDGTQPIPSEEHVFQGLMNDLLEAFATEFVAGTFGAREELVVNGVLDTEKRERGQSAFPPHIRPIASTLEGTLTPFFSSVNYKSKGDRNENSKHAKMLQLVIIPLAFLITSCWHCQDELVDELRSPSGKYKVVARKCGCDVSTGLHISIDISESHKEVACMTSELAGFKVHDYKQLKMKWESDTVLVASFPGTEIGRSPTGSYSSKEHPVTIIFK